MRPKYLSMMMAGVVLLCLSISVSPVAADTLFVCQGNPEGLTCVTDNIQAAINLASDGDTVYVYGDGPYEGFTVNRTGLTVEGYKSKPVVRGRSFEDAKGVIRIENMNVSLSYFKVQPNWSGQRTYGLEIESHFNDIISVDASDFYYGIFINGTSLNLIENCSGSNNTIGLYIWDLGSGNATDNLVSRCTFTDGMVGIDVQGDNNTISLSQIENMTNEGLSLGSAYRRSSGNRINENYFTNNTGSGAILLYNCSGNIINHNKFFNNTYGLYPVSTGSNSIYDNLFSDSIVYGGGGANTWNITKQYAGDALNIIGGSFYGGNYWASPGQDFSRKCSDEDQDGICDSPYTNATYNIDDRLPLTNNPPSDAPEVISISPDTGVNTGPISRVRIKGSGFQEGASVYIQSDYARINATDVVVVNDALITCTLDLTDEPTDYPYDVYVLNPGEQEGVLEDAFTVIEPGISGEVSERVTLLEYHLKSLGEDINRKTISAYPVLLENPNVVLLGTWGEKTFGEGEGALVFVDDHPKANWEHPCRYFFLDSNGGIIDSHETYSPALNYLFTYVDGVQPTPDGLYTPSDPDMWKPACVENCTNYWALLISGGTNSNLNYRRYWEDLAFMYTTLLDYGYDPTHIKLLISDGMNTALDRNMGGSVLNDSPKDLNGDGSPETIVLANRSNLFAELDKLKTTIPASGNLLIFTTAHGGWSGTANSSRLYLWNNEYISDTDFVNNITSRFGSINSITMVMGQCYGGGFNNEFVTGGTQKRVLITAANGSEPSWGSGFLNAWTTGVAGHDRFLAPDLGADTNNDERVSLSESFEYARTRDPFNGIEHPQKFMQPAGTDTNRFLNDCTGTVTKSITVTYPNAAGITWYKGERHLITWNVQGIPGNVNVYLYKGTSNVATVATNVPATPGVYSYLVPSLTAATNYKIRVTDASSSSVYDMSDNYFTVKTEPAGTGSLYFIVTNQSNGQEIGANITCVNENCGCGPTPCTISSLVTGERKVDVTLDGYYPRSYDVIVTKDVTSQYKWSLEPIPKDANTGEFKDWPPFGTIDVSSSPSGATIWTKMGGASDWVNQGETAASISLVTGDYEVKVTKDGYEDSDPQQVHILPPCPQENPPCLWREPERLYFELEPLQPEGPMFPKITAFTITPPQPVLPVGGSIAVNATVEDKSDNSPLTAIWEWGDGKQDEQGSIHLNSPIPIGATHAYNRPGVYIITLYVTNNKGFTASMEAPSYVAVYDPNAGFVTGGGWINSPPGACVADPALTGKAIFGFVSKYVKGKTLPQGETEFQFRVANLNFKSSSYEWLVITNAKAQFKGKGTINGAGNYGFMLTAIDGQVKGADGNDKFRIKIWDRNNGDSLVYDNQLSAPDTADPTTIIGGGSIVIQQAKK